MAKKEKKGISFHEALKDIQKGNIAGVYLLHGEETYLADQLRQKITMKVLGSEKDDFNLHVFYGKEIVMESLLTALTSFPVMADRQVVVLREAEALKKNEREILEKHLERLDETCCFIVMAAHPDFRLKLFQMLHKDGVSVQLDKLSESDMPEMIRNMLKEKGKEISDSAAMLMTARLNLSLQELEVEIEKLASYTGARNSVSEEDVEAITGLSRQYNVFELCQRIADRNYEESVKIFRNMLQRGEEPAGMIALIFRQYNILWQIAECTESSCPQSEIEQIIKEHFNIPPYYLRTSYMGQARQFKASHLRESFDFLIQADRDLKSISVKPEIIMEKLIYLLIYGTPR